MTILISRGNCDWQTYKENARNVPIKLRFIPNVIAVI